MRTSTSSCRQARGAPDDRDRRRAPTDRLPPAERLVRARGGRRIFVVHRLDRETSGLLVFAKSFAVKRALQGQSSAHARAGVRGRVEGVVREEEGTLTSYLVENRPWRSKPRAADRRRSPATGAGAFRRATLLELALVTGRRGQIRAQLAALGHPIVATGSTGAAAIPSARLPARDGLGFVTRAGARLLRESPPAGLGRPRPRRASAQPPSPPRAIRAALEVRAIGSSFVRARCPRCPTHRCAGSAANPSRLVGRGHILCFFSPEAVLRWRRPATPIEWRAGGRKTQYIDPRLRGY